MQARLCSGIGGPPRKASRAQWSAIADMLEEGRCVDQDLVGAVLWYRNGREYRLRARHVPSSPRCWSEVAARLDAEEAHGLVSEGRRSSAMVLR